MKFTSVYSSSSVFLLLCSFFCRIIVGYEVSIFDGHREGFFNSYLPGSPMDTSNTTNTPWTTDTNRYSDGVSSTAYFDVISPGFPEYSGGLASVTERVEHYVNYMDNAARQGVAGYNQGDAVKEQARVKYLKSVGGVHPFPPAPTLTFPVYAAIKWNPSDFAIQEQETYVISAKAPPGAYYTDQTWTDGGIRVTADGYNSFYDAVSNCYVALGRCRSHLKKRKRLTTANWMTLVCAVGEFVRPVQEVDPGDVGGSRFVPLDESVVQKTLFAVGSETTFTAQNSGQLICFANDAHTLYWNNAGSLNVTITRTSWPPSSVTYYEALGLPACDSAYAVYAALKNSSYSNITDCNPYGGGDGWSHEAILAAKSINSTILA